MVERAGLMPHIDAQREPLAPRRSGGVCGGPRCVAARCHPHLPPKQHAPPQKEKARLAVTFGAPPSGKVAAMVASMVAESSYSTSPVPSLGDTFAESVRPSVSCVSYSSSYVREWSSPPLPPPLEESRPTARSPEPSIVESRSFDSLSPSVWDSSRSHSRSLTERVRVPVTRVTREERPSTSASTSIVVPSSVEVSRVASSGPPKFDASSYLILSTAPLSEALLRNLSFSARSYSAVTVAALPSSLKACDHLPLMLSREGVFDPRSPEISSTDPD
mmetsp:Transcript_5204/g.16475  ORF Transcript_5204/g.16475 Transcript_5204/m.16475 type:complete len:275 (+) Transcript_5204:982-1806(+)